MGNLRVQRNNSTVVGNFEVILNYDNLKITLKAGMVVRGKGPDFTIIRTNGSFVRYGMDIQEKNLKNRLIPSQCKDLGFGSENL
ncbi:hypothetical protein NRP93_000720 [Clostridium botulinum]|nr:hypothetical protein [Clostridium botulinum]